MKKILVVDDERAITELLVSVLRDEGYAVAAAEDGPRALQLLPTERPDLVILDVMMPRMDGREVCRRMREMAGFERLHIVMISAAIHPNLAECRVDAFLAKPFDLNRLLATLEDVLRAGED